LRDPPVELTWPLKGNDEGKLNYEIISTVSAFILAFALASNDVLNAACLRDKGPGDKSYLPFR